MGSPKPGLRAPAAETPLDRSTFLCKVPQLSTGILGYLRLCVGVLASTIIIARLLVPRRSAVLLLWLKVFAVIPFPLSSPLLIEVVTPLPHRPFYVDRSVV